MIRDKDYIENKINILKRIWIKFPQLRFGQLLGACTTQAMLYNLDDDALINLIMNSYKIPKDVLTETDEEKFENGTWNKGRIYVHKGDEVRAIKNSELQDYLDKGFIKGKK